MIKPVLTIGMIFRDDVRSLEHCLTALAPLRQAVPSELIMADTGSIDGSREIAEKYADILFDFPWIDDFAAARNAVMERASGEWFFSLDADEYLDEDIRELVRLVHGQDTVARRAIFGNMVIRNYGNYELDGNYSDFSTQRLVRMSSGRRFEGRIHEPWHPAPDDTTVLLRCILHHDGYVGLGDERGQAKRTRNLILLRRELERDPDSLSRLVQFIESGQNEPDVLLRLERAVALVKQKTQGWALAGPAIFRYAVSIAEERNLPELEERVREAREWFPDSYCTRIDVNYLMFSHHWEANDYTACIPYGKAYLAAYEDSFSNEAERNRAQSDTLLCGAPGHQRNMKIFLAAALLWSGQPEDAPAVLEGLDYTLLNVQQTGLLTEVIFGLHAKSHVDTSSLVSTAWRGIESSKSKRGGTEERRAAFLQTGAKAFANQTAAIRPAWEAFLPLAGRCILGDAAAIMRCEDQARTAALLAEVTDWGALPAAALVHGLEQGVAFPLPERPLNLEEMDALAVRLTEKENALYRLLNRTAADNFAGSRQTLAWTRGLALAAVQSFDWKAGAPEGVKLARTFAEVERAFLPACYAPEALQEEGLCFLPPMHRFGWYCARAFQALDCKDAAGYTHMLRQGLKTCESMKNMVEFLLENTPELQMPPPSPELLVLAEQVRTMLAAYDPKDPAVRAIRESPVYQRVAYLIEGDGAPDRQ